MNKELLEKFASLEANAINQAIEIYASLDAKVAEALTQLASLTDEDRQELIDYWTPLYGKEYSIDQTKDYLPRGKKQVVATLTPKDRGVESQYWQPLYGSEYAQDMVEDYKNDAAKKEVEASNYLNMINKVSKKK